MIISLEIRQRKILETRQSISLGAVHGISFEARLCII